MNTQFINSRSSISEQRFFAGFSALKPVSHLNLDTDDEDSRTTSNILYLADQTIAYPPVGCVITGCLEYDFIKFDYTGYANERDPLRLSVRGIVEIGMNPRLLFLMLSGKIVIVVGRNPTVTYVYLMGKSKQLTRPFVLSIGRIYIVEFPPQSEWSKAGIDFLLSDSSFNGYEEFHLEQCLIGTQARRRRSWAYVFDDLD